MAHVHMFPPLPVGKTIYKPDMIPEVKKHIINLFLLRSQEDDHYDSYFKFFRNTVLDSLYGLTPSDDRHFAMDTYEDLEKVVTCLKNNPDDTRSEIAKKLAADFSESSEAQKLRSVELAAHLLLTIHVRSWTDSVAPLRADTTAVEWDDEASLKKMVKDKFIKIPDVENPDLEKPAEMPIDPKFTLKSLRKLCGIKVRWTNNLKDHLRYDQDTANLHLYPHTICLLRHKEDSCEIIPDDLIDETVKSLELLLPFQEKTKVFYRPDSSYNEPRAIDFNKFRYWRKRLLELDGIFKQAPRNFYQMLVDRRNPLQWWTFWIAVTLLVLTIFFGILTTYAGFRQITLAEELYDLTVLQGGQLYNLTFIQACSANNLSEGLEDFCARHS